MQSPWFGGVFMLVLIAGLAVWMWWAMREKKGK